MTCRNIRCYGSHSTRRVDITSAAWSANQTITNKAYILLSRLGVTDMVEDSTIACQCYFSGSGTNEITFRGTAQTNAAAGFPCDFNGSGVGDTVTAGEASYRNLTVVQIWPKKMVNQYWQ